MEQFAIYQTKIGVIYIGYNDDIITHISIAKEEIKNFGIKTDFTDNVYKQLTEYFNGNRQQFDFKISLSGTDFQKKVYNELCNIPYGETRTYKQIAIAIGNEKACRAVGMANNKNPIIIVVPCHRVIGANGSLVGYAGGLSLKQHLLDLEKCNRPFFNSKK